MRTQLKEDTTARTNTSRDEIAPLLGKSAAFEDKIVQRRLRILRRIEGFVGREETLLDIGCGNGASMFLLAGEMKRCLGIDVSEDYRIEFESSKARKEVSNCEFRILDIDSESLDERFDRLISFEVIEHLQKEQSVQFYYDALESGGLAAITVPNKWWVFETHGARLPLLPWNRVPFFSWLPRGLHERFANARIYTKRRIHTLLTSVGFEVLSMTYVTAPMDVLRDGWLKSWLTKTIFRNDETSVPFLATAIFVVARKNV